VPMFLFESDESTVGIDTSSREAYQEWPQETHSNCKGKAASNQTRA